VAYDVELADRLRSTLAGEPGVAEKRMFGGLAFLVDGHLAVSASSRGGLLLRVDPATAESLLDQDDVEPFVMRGRPVTGWLHVGTEAVADDDALRRWVARGLRSARSLPPGDGVP
jgi:TfoX/Sxy family transcriptional regulator of competence genes